MALRAGAAPRRGEYHWLTVGLRGTARRLARRVFPAAACALFVAAGPAGAYEVSTTGGFAYPVGAAVSPDGSSVLVSNLDHSPADGQFYLGAPLGTAGCSASPFSLDMASYRPGGLVFAPDGSRAYVAGDPSSVVVVDPATCQVDGAPVTLPVGSGPGALAINRQGTRIYTANALDSSVSVVDPRTRTVINTALLATPIGQQPSDVEVSADGSKVYVTAYVGGTVWSLDTTDNATFSSVALTYPFDNPSSVAFSPDGSRAYVANTSNAAPVAREVTVIDTASGQVVDGFTSAGEPKDIAVSPGGNLLYVTNFLANSLSIMDASTGEVRATVALPGSSGSRGGAVALNPAGTRAWVTSPVDDSVHVVRLGPGAPTGLAASPGTGSAAIAFTPGTSNGAPVTDYQYSLDGGAWTSAGSASAPVTVSGLSAGTAYSVRLRAINGQAPGDPSVPVAFKTSTSPGPSPGPSVSIGTAKVSVGRRSVSIRTAVTPSAAGTVTQVARQRSGRRLVTRCRTFRTGKAARQMTLICRIGASGRRYLRKRSMRLISTFTLKAANGSAASATKSTTIKRRR